MAFSGFGAASSAAPTGAAGTSTAGGGLFGSTSTPAASTSLFGAPATSQPAAGSSLFGNAAKPAGTSLFGSSTAATTQPAAGSLFGTAPAASAAPAAGSLFGNAASSAPATTSLFSTTPATTAQPTSSLFGSTAAKPATTSLFGTASTAPKSAGLNSSFGGGLNQAQSVPGVKIDLANLRGTTRFGDLHEDLQKLVEAIDKQILQEMEYHKQVEAFLPGHADQLEYVPNDVDFVTKRYETAIYALDRDAQGVDAALKTNKADAADAKRIFAAQDRLKLPPQYHQQSIWESRNAASSANSEGSNYDLVQYFSRRTDGVKSQLEGYKGTLAEIEEHLQGVEARTMQQLQQLMYDRGVERPQVSSEDQLRELSGVLRGFEEGILKVASKVGGAREGVQELVLAESGLNVNGSDRRR